MKKYILTENTKNISGCLLYQIQYMIDIPIYGIKSGDLGGWIEKEDNLPHTENCVILDNTCVSGDAMVYGNAQIYGDACICGNAHVCDNAHVYGNAHVCGNACVCDNAHVYDNAWVYDNAHVRDNARVCGNAHICGNARVYNQPKLTGGEWTDRVLYISGLSYPISLCDNSKGKEILRVGCQKHTIEHWLTNWRTIAKKYNMPENEIVIYQMAYNLIAKYYDLPQLKEN